MTGPSPSSQVGEAIFEPLLRMLDDRLELGSCASAAADLRRALAEAEPETLAGTIETRLAEAQVGAGAAVRLLDGQAALGFTPQGLVLAAALARRFAGDERLADIELRYLMALGRHEAAIGSVRHLLAMRLTSAQLAYRIVLALSRAGAAGHGVEESISQGALGEFLRVIEASPERSLWLGRYYREVGNAIVALRHYLDAWETLPPDNGFKTVALREAGDLALSGDRWGRDAAVLLRARQADIASSWPWRAAAVARAFDYVGAGHCLDAHANLPGTTTYSHLYSMLGTPEIAFDYLLDEVVPARAPYQPLDCLLMVGTSLAGGGMERIFANSYRAVLASGVFARVRMALLTFAPGSRTAFYLPESGAAADDITVLTGQVIPEFPASLLPIGLGRRVWRAYQLILRERPRIVHAWNDLPGIVAAYAAILAGCPKIFIHFHHMRAINLSSDRNLVRSYPHCYRRLLERPEVELLFVSDASAVDYADWWSVRRSAKFTRLFNGFAEPAGGIPDRDAARRALGLPLDALVVGTVFRFHAVKRPLLWIEAARLIRAALPGAVFVMVGDGALWEEARARVAELGLEAAFHFPGQVKNVPDYLACFDLFMLTSISEGLPNSLVEAQLAGAPVLSTDAGGARETFVPDITGRLADASAEALAKAAVECLTDDEWRGRARSLARANALSLFGIDRYVESLLALYGASQTAREL